MEIVCEDFQKALTKIKLLRENANIIEETVQRSVREIVQNVRESRDEALSFYTKKFDGVEIKDVRVSEEEIKQASMFVESSFLEALQEAKKNIISYHEKQKRQSMFDCTSKGIIRGQIIRPLENIGVYVPGGTASYPSSVLMNVLPAKLAGVKKIVMVTPPRAGGIDPHILVAASLAGVDEIYMIGGAQAIAALAYGTNRFQK